MQLRKIDLNCIPLLLNRNFSSIKKDSKGCSCLQTLHLSKKMLTFFHILCTVDLHLQVFYVSSDESLILAEK